jgi:poly(3-hydroxybutyrate) depolymerase
VTVPLGAPLNMIMPVDDEMLFNKYREYYLFLPENMSNTEPLPLTISYHGFYDEAIDLEKTDKLMAMSIETGGSFIVVHPQGMMDTGTRTPQVPYPQRTWNGGGTVGSPGKYGHVCNTTARKADWGT